MRMSFSKVELERDNFKFGVKNDETGEVEWFETPAEQSERLAVLVKEEAAKEEEVKAVEENKDESE